MMKAPVDTNFIHDLSQLDALRKQATQAGGQEEALKAAAKQFEAIFTQMLFKSMRDANAAFESDLIDNRTSKFYQQMADEQMSSALSNKGALGLADLIVDQLKTSLPASSETSENENQTGHTLPQARVFPIVPLNLSQQANKLDGTERFLNKSVNAVLNASMNEKENVAKKAIKVPQMPTGFSSPSEFVSNLLPHARQAADSLGTDPAMLLAQAALETGWGQKVLSDKGKSSHNLFNIKADKRWQGDKLTTNTLEFRDGVANREVASFRRYDSFKESFNDFVSFLSNNPRYRDALSQSAKPHDFIQGLHQAGYATDPNYADKVISVFQQIKGMLGQQ